MKKSKFLNSIKLATCGFALLFMTSCQEEQIRKTICLILASASGICITLAFPPASIWELFGQGAASKTIYEACELILAPRSSLNLASLDAYFDSLEQRERSFSLKSPQGASLKYAEGVDTENENQEVGEEVGGQEIGLPPICGSTCDQRKCCDLLDGALKRCKDIGVQKFRDGCERWIRDSIPSNCPASP